MHLFVSLLVWIVSRPFSKEVTGTENLPKESAIIVANHQSYADGMLLFSLIKLNTGRSPRFLAMRSLFRNWLTKLILGKYLGCVEVNGSTEEALHALKKGEIIVIFPEGHRTPNGKMLPAKHGAAVLAHQTGTPVIPVRLNTFNFWPKTRLFPWFNRSITIKVGKPIQFKKKQVSKKQIQTTTNAITKKIQQL